jgi:hypothetical protein
LKISSNRVCRLAATPMDPADCVGDITRGVTRASRGSRGPGSSRRGCCSTSPAA